MNQMTQIMIQKKRKLIPQNRNFLVRFFFYVFHYFLIYLFRNNQIPDPEASGDPVSEKDKKSS